MTKKSEAERQEKIELLREVLKPGNTVYTVLTHATKSGMHRSIKVVVPVFYNSKSIMFNRELRIQDITYWVSVVIGEKMDNTYGGVRVSGTGMDMGFGIIESLSRELGFPLRQMWI